MAHSTSLGGRLRRRTPHHKRPGMRPAQGAPVHGARVAGLRDQLGRQVLGRAAQRLAFAAGRDLLGEAEVGHLDVALGID